MSARGRVEYRNGSSNRDYFTRPIQSDRHTPGYGRTQFQPESEVSNIVGIAIGALMVLTVIWFAIQFTR